MRSTLFYLLFAILVFTSCKQNNNKGGSTHIVIKTNNQLLQDLAEKYPQLNTGKKDITNYYKFEKSITLTKPSVQLQLFLPDDENDQQKIVIISNEKDSYAIPFLDNLYKSYWNFPFDTPVKQELSVHTTFEGEVNQGFKKLSLNKGFNGNWVIGEIFRNLLNDREVYDNDTASIKTEFWIYDKLLPDDDEDACNWRLAKNYKAIMLLVHSGVYSIDWSVFLDRKNGRIYQLQYNGLNSEKENFYKIRIYRHSRVVTQMKM
jgi:hypothetical protein